MIGAVTSVGSLQADYQAITQACGLFDRSERGKLALSGPNAKSFLQGQVSNDVEALTPGSGCYAAFLTPKGKMLGDLRILDAGDELLLDTERAALQELFNMIRRFSIGYDVRLRKRTLESALLSLIGPGTDAVIDLATAPAAPAPSAALAPPTSGAPTDTEFDHACRRIGRSDVRLIRTDGGVDLLFAADALDEVRAALLDAGAAPVDERAVECLRIERGQPRYGVDLDDAVIPQEAGLNDRAVSFTKGCYVGQETVARLFYRGKPNRQLRGLRSDVPLARGDTLSYAGRPVGTVTSTAASPRFGAIALALVRREAPPGSTVSVAGEATAASAEVVELPFA
jgi:tRNA-modifying protein YgfZ